jgi:thioredoxin 1
VSVDADEMRGASSTPKKWLCNKTFHFRQRIVACIALAMVTELNEADFTREVIESPIPVLVDFWSEKCEPCKNLLPVLGQLAEDLAGRAKIVKMDAFANMSLASGFGVRSVPNLLFFKNGEVKDQFVGANITRDQLKARLEALM